MLNPSPAERPALPRAVAPTQAAAEYWKTTLADAPELLELPTDRARSARQDHAGARVGVELDEALRAGLEALSRRHGATPSMTLLAGWAVVLGRLSGQEDVVVGTPAVVLEEIEEADGSADDALAIRVDLSGAPTVAELLERVKERALGALHHRAIPLEQVVELVRPARGSSHHPLFQVTFAWRDAPRGDGLASDVDDAGPESPHAQAKFDLSLTLGERDGRIVGSVTYATALFDRATVERWVGYLRRVLEAMVADERQRVDRLVLMPESERLQVLEAWNATARPYPAGACVHDLFRAQAARTPEAVALSWQGERLTYAGLEARANRLANALRRRGVGPEVRVGICLPRAPDLVAAMLGVLKAGGAYVPLDPAYPRERLGYMLQDAAVTLVITDSALADRLPENAAARLLLDRERDAVASESAEAPSVVIHPENLSHVIFTSGSTGRPKGVMIRHSSTVVLLYWLRENVTDDERSSVLFSTSINFDVSIAEVFGTLCWGGKLVLVENALELATVSEPVVYASMVPSAAAELLRSGGIPASVRTLNLGGEALPNALAQGLYALGTVEKVGNLYGPTEDTTYSTYHLVPRGAEQVLVGAPVANTQAYVLDRHLQPVPMGAAGELYLAGDGLSRGYANRPAMTAERFVPNPFGAPGSRMYRVMDRVRWKEVRESSGDDVSSEDASTFALSHSRTFALEYLGRTDFQVKVRGYRIELGEIEARLAEHAGVHEAVVVAREDTPGDRRLVAYVVPDGNGADADVRDGEAESLESQHEGDWRAAWQLTYGDADAAADRAFDTRGWTSSYTGQPIPADEMHAWVDATVARIGALRPARVLEIGCGTGLLLSRVAPGCERYVGLDFSAHAVARIEALRRERPELAHVEVQRRSADELDGFEAESFDTVIINSVVQYFPGLEYLARVLEGAARVVRPGGRVFVGDVRDLRLLDAFRTAVETHASPPSRPVEEWRGRAEQARAQEAELVIDPAFFWTVGRDVAAVGRVETLAKRGGDRNELTEFRYDVVLHVGDADADAEEETGLDWRAERLTLEALRARLEEAGSGAVVVREIPNARVSRALQQDALRRDPRGLRTVDEVRRAAVEEGVDPEALWALGEALGWTVEVRLAGSNDAGRVDALFTKGTDGRRAFPAPAFGERLEVPAYGTDPLRVRRTGTLVRGLREHLAARLPEYMVPASYVALDRLPHTPNGKVDRKALPAPAGDAFARGAYEAPESETERALAGIWSEVLSVAAVSRRDRFFDLGGHSLLAVRVVSRVRQALGVEASPRDLFERPVLADFARVLETAAHAEAAAIVPVDRSSAIPLSFAQQRLWFIGQMEGAGAAYHLPVRLRLKGALDRESLVHALERIVARHEALRTTFPETDGVPAQRIAAVEESSFPFVEHDLEGRPEAPRELGRLVAEEAGAPFDLARGPLVRGRLIRLAADDHVLLITMHHIVSDGWSMGIFSRELSALYGAFARGDADPLPPLPVQYADYAAWQRRWVDGDLLRMQADYWTETLAGAPELLELPTDHPRPARQDFAGASLQIELDEGLTAALKTLGQRHGATLYMTLLAGWAAVLARLSGQDEVVVGTPSANRGHAEIEGLIGFFVNTLPLRVDLSGSPRVGELLGRVKERSLGAQHHQDIPFEQVVERVRPVRSLAHTPLFQVMLAWQEMPGGDLELPGIAAVPLDGAGEGAAAFDLALSLAPRGGRIAGELTYATALFERATVERWVGYLRRVLQGMVAVDGGSVERLELLSAAERRRVVEEWNATDAALPAGACVHELFEAQAARTPDATALVYENEAVTYAELNERANRLAHHLAGLGVGPETRVGICLERGPEMIVSVLAVLKAGGAYVPLDPAYPAERLAYVLADAAAPVLVTQESLRAALLAGDGVAVVSVDRDGARIAAESAENPERGVSPDHLAYVIYTSGSTGRPKGVMVPHRGVPNLAYALARRFGIDGTSRVLQFASLSFDAAVAEVFEALLSGAALVLAPREALLPGPGLLETLRRGRVTVATLPPPVLAVLSPDDLPALRTVVSAGEAVDAATVTRWSAGRAFVNAYGPTEITVCATSARCEADGRVPAIGRPLENVRAYVLDAFGQPAPIGVPGELYVGGVGVVRGYLGRAGLTAEKFVPDPFGGETGARLYRTGDRVRWSAGGELEFLGRVDEQVKVRGFRIEPGEIEARLAEHAGVREAVVLVREDASAEKRLVAYVVGNATADAEALRAHLSKRLPEYMVPAAYVRLDALPLTPNGKVDRRSLPAPEGDAFAARGYEAPSNKAEETVAAIWAELLGAEQVGRRDHFFELGGHSLLAVRVVSRVRQSLRVEAAPSDLFERPVLADFARGLETAARAEAAVIERVDRTGNVPLSFAQQRLWFLEQLGNLGGTYHIPVGLRLRGELDRGALVRSLDRIVDRHEALRTTFPAADGEPVQRIAPVEESAFRLVEHDLRASQAAEDELRRLVSVEGSAPFDLARGPLIRGRLVRIAPDDHALLLTMHHIVSDGWSAGVLFRELGALYAAFTRGEPDPLPPLPVQYADYAAWHRRLVEGPVLAAQSEYWTRTLAGAPELLELPADRPRPARQEFAGASLKVELDEALTAALKTLSQRHGTTLFMTLLAGWAVVLARLSGQDDVVVGMPSAGRGSSEIEGLIGFFVNTLALRVDVSGTPTVAELLGRVRERALEAQRHQDLPFEQVVERVQPARSLSHTPLFQVMLAWQEMPGRDLELPGITAAPVDGVDEGTAAFDLMLSLAPRGGRIAGEVTYATALFDRATIERHVGYLRRVLQAMAAGDVQPVDRLDLLSAAERRTVVEEWNATDAGYPAGACVHDLFRSQAAQTPAAVALSWRGERWTYAELEARANRLANALRRRGVGPEVRVGICLPRTPELVGAMLGVLKAGGAYVPLDPAYPRERLGYMLQDAAVTLVITDSVLADRLPETAAALLLLDGERDAIAAESADAPRVDVHPENLSHVIFTSGSTGRPKGVMIRHSSTVVLLHWLRENVTDAERSSVLFSTSINFDVSIAEVFGTLAWGGKLVIVENALELATLGEDVVYASMVPSAAAELLRSGGIPASVRTLNLGGEALPNVLAQGLYALGTVEKVGNLYGPTEDTTYSTYSLVPRGAEQVLVGRPVANTQAYVLDRHLQPVPMGVAGELYLAGDGLSRGYASHPAMTAERFVPCPFGAPGSRMYRVMDRVRWKKVRGSSGDDVSCEDASTFALSHSRTFALEYLGRTDFQVKVRGYRIELGEIEARLAEHPGVRAPVVLVREDAPGDRRLVAYYQADAPVAVDALKSHLADRLPGYMVPAAYVWMEAYPLTPNGKTDRRALPAPEGDAFAARAYEAPVGEVENVLAAIWAEVTGAGRVGRHDDFFELGGHSLLAVRVVSRVRQALGVEAEIGDLFVRPVLADFARGLETAARAEATVIVPVERSGPVALSFAQQRLWFLEQLGSLGSTYHIPSRLRLKGTLDRDALAGALDRIVARHEALRTTFAQVGGVPEQRIAPAEASGFALAQHDLSGAADPEAALQRLLADETRAPFDLERGPLIRGRLVRLAADDHVLLVTMHHIVSDGWSMGVLFGELAALYAARVQGREADLPALPVQYADYAAWQRGWIKGELLERQASYWERSLAGAPELLELPTDRARPQKQDFAGDTVDVELDEALTGALKALSQRHGATLFMTLLAAWATVLARLSGQDDVVVGTPSANRGQREVEELIGFFVNMLPLRVDLSGAPTVAELLRQVRTRALDAQRHQDVPLEEVVERVRPARSLAHTPLFQVMFAWQNAPEERLDLPGLQSAAVPGHAAETAKFDLTLDLAQSGDRIVGGLTYATALFDRATVERWVGYLRRALEAMAADETRPVDRLQIVPEAERRRVLEAWSRAGAAEPGASRVHALFEARVARTPGAAAVVIGRDRLTYAELNAAANRLARRLRAAGVGPEARVGVMLERSAELVVALLAVLKAGGAYLPLDPALPAARRAALAADAGAAVLVTRDSGLEGFAGTIVSPAEADGEDGGDLGLDVPAAALAYVIYTSGSTGTPKGVGVAHAEAAAHCRAAAGAYGLTPADRVLQFAAAGFDVSVEQMLAPLSAGACVVLRGNEVPTPLELARQAAEQGLTVVNPPTAYWHQLAADAAALEILARTVRLVIAGGEAMSPAAARGWAAGPAAGVRLLNGYGPTEAVVTCTAYDVPPALPEGAVHVPVGRPLPGRAAYVVDGWMNPAPLGAPGELCIGGVLARGYLGRPAATAAAFVPDPFSATPGARMYRTGDRARWLAVGELEFLGRRDHQVKVRGYRIELGEIEARLAEHPGVREAVVVAREDTPGDRRLVAYVVGDETIGAEALRAQLGKTLPAYMVPSAFVRLEALPLTPNGKLDRGALPVPEGDSQAAREYEAPVGKVEQALAGIWAELLGVERVGRGDDFFMLGGHSLLGVQMISRVREAMSVELALGALFEQPALSALAERIMELRLAQFDPETVARLARLVREPGA
jgi:amino acid adenylation domain-containing protein